MGLPPIPDQLIGRERELAELDGALGEALGSRGRLVLVAGEPGIGKTSLADEVTRRAVELGARPLWGRCWEGGGAPAYWPWVEVIREAVHLEAAAPLLRQMGPGAAHIAQIAPEVHDLLLSGASAQGGDEAKDRFQLFDAVTSFLVGCSQTQPLLLVFDDLHAAGLPSLRLLAFFAHAVRRLRGLVYGTYREAEALLQPDVSAALADVSRDGTILRLGGLDESQVREVMAARMRGPVSDELAQRVHELTGGNPLFVSELARLYDARGQAPGGAGDVVPTSGTVSHTIRQRVDMLSPDARETLAIATVFGRTFALAPLAAVAGVDLPRLDGLMEEAALLGIVTRHPTERGRLSFSHALVGEVLYDTIPLDARPRLHEQAGRALERFYGADVEAHVAELGHQFLKATAAGAEEALRYTVRAAERATSQSAHEEAVEWYQRAIDVQQTYGVGVQKALCELLVAMGRAQARAGRAPEAHAALLRAWELSKTLADAPLMANVALVYSWHGLVTGVVDRVTVGLLEEALSALDDEDGALRVDVMTRLVLEFVYADSADDIRRRTGLAAEAVEAARRLGDDTSLIYALEAAAWAEAGPENVRERVATGEEILRLAARAGETTLTKTPIGHLLRFPALLELGDRAGAERELRLYERVAESIREPDLLWYVTSSRAALALLDGDVDRADELSARALSIGEPGRAEEARLYHGVQQLVLARTVGDPDRLAARLREFEDLADRFPTLPAIRAAIGCVLADIGRPAAARAELERVLATPPESMPRNTTWLATLAFLAELSCLLGDEERAARLRDLLAPFADHVVVLDAAIVCLGSAQRHAGLLAAATGDQETAVASFESALLANRRLGARPALAQTECEYADVLAGRDGVDVRSAGAGPDVPVRVRQLRAAAMDTARELGLTGLRRRVEDADPAPARERTRAGPPTGQRCLFRHQGDYWTVEYAGDRFQLRDVKGLHHLARLLASPGGEVLALDLVVGSAADGERHARSAHDLSAEGLSSDGPGDAGAILDPAAKTAYRERIRDLRAEVEEAEALNDRGRSERARDELDFLTRELAAAVGLGGRDRKGASDLERARVNVTRTIRYACDKISEVSPALGKHLDVSIRTGVYCSYQPDPQTQQVWEF